MDEYALDFEPGWDAHFKKFDASIQDRVWKKIRQLKRLLKHRHMKHGVPYFVEEVGSYRIAFEVLEERKIKNIIFVGDHKQYERWYNSSRTQPL